MYIHRNQHLKVAYCFCHSGLSMILVKFVVHFRQMFGTIPNSPSSSFKIYLNIISSISFKIINQSFCNRVTTKGVTLFPWGALFHSDSQGLCLNGVEECPWHSLGVASAGLITYAVCILHPSYSATHERRAAL